MPTVAELVDGIVATELRKFNKNQLRDPGGEGGGRWVKAPSAGEVLKDVLKLGSRKRNKTELAPGEELLGSGVLSGKEGAEVLLAFTRRADGSRTVRIATGVEDRKDWGANDRGGTAVLDERGISRLRNELDRMGEAEKEFKAKYKAADAKYEDAKKRQHALLRPHLSAAQLSELDRVDEDVESIPLNIDRLETSLQERIDDLPSESFDDYERLDKEIEQAVADGDRQLTERLREQQLRLFDDLPASKWGSDPPEGVRRDRERLDEYYRREAIALLRRDELLAGAALSPSDAAALDQAGVDRANAWDELTGDLSEVVLVDGLISGEWTDVGFRTDTDELGDVTHYIDVRPANARDDWYPGQEGFGPLTFAELKKLSAMLGRAVDPDTTRSVPDASGGDGRMSLSVDDRMIPYDPEKHPHAPAGTSTGGQFTPAKSSGSKPAPKQAMGKRRPAKHAAPAKNRERPSKDNPDLFFDPAANTGTGYDQDGGDPRVRKLQEALNRLGLKDAKGKRLRVDGELGPLTTQAVKAAQQKLGMKPDGRVTPALLDQLAKAKSLARRSYIDDDGEFRRVLPDTQTRAFDFELRSASSDGRTLEGYVAVFGATARIADHGGDFDEEIHRGAFDRSLKRSYPVMQFDHGRDPRTGTVPIGVYDTFEPDSRGYYVKGELFDNPVVEPIRQAIKGKAIKGMSWRMLVTPKVGDRWTRRTGQPDKRDIVDADVPEAGPVVFPAYDVTSVSVRSILANFSSEERAALIRELADEVRMAVRLTPADVVDLVERAREGGYTADEAIEAVRNYPTDLTTEPDTRSAAGGERETPAGECGATHLSPMDPNTRDRVLKAFGVLSHG